MTTYRDVDPEIHDLVRCIHPERGWTQAEVVAVQGHNLIVQAPKLGVWIVSADEAELIID